MWRDFALSLCTGVCVCVCGSVHWCVWLCLSALVRVCVCDGGEAEASGIPPRERESGGNIVVCIRSGRVRYWRVFRRIDCMVQ